jgi:hypothetical protein
MHFGYDSPVFTPYDAMQEVRVKFRVSRNYMSSKPCDNAVWEECLRVDRRTVNDPAKLDPKYETPDSWQRKGSNHRIERGMIARDVPDRAWFIELESAEELLALIRAYDGALVAPSDNWPDDWEISLEHTCQ